MLLDGNFWKKTNMPPYFEKPKFYESLFVQIKCELLYNLISHFFILVLILVSMLLNVLIFILRKKFYQYILALKDPIIFYYT